MKRLENKVAVITGGNSGIGLATAKLFVAEGAKVIVNARNENRLKESKDLEAEGITVIKADVSNKSDLENLFKEVNEQFGKIDILFANAGVAKFAPISLLSDQDVDNMLNVNIKGVFYTVKYANPFLNDGASVILTSSHKNTKGDPGSSVYAATKAAVRSFAKTFSAELSPRKIRVNALSPGATNTPIIAKLGMNKEQGEKMAQAISLKIPMGRLGNPEELAKAALFLASDDSSYVMGEELNVNGGTSLT